MLSHLFDVADRIVTAAYQLGLAHGLIAGFLAGLVASWLAHRIKPKA